jgi:tetratricopeptide (TPR) repeat protein
MGIRVKTGCSPQRSRSSTTATFILLIWFGTLPGGAVYAQGNYNGYILVHENFAICNDASQPLAKRTSSCTVVIERGGLVEPANLAALMGRAQSNARKSMSEALVDCTRVIELDPKSVTAYLRRGNVQFDLREYAAALNDYSDSLKLDPDQAVVLYNGSLAAARMGRLKDANDDRRRALVLDASVASEEEKSAWGK